MRLDIEAELGFVVGGSTAIGARVGVDEAADHVFGVVLLNDWTARDIQAWEYVPLGPFLGKSFSTSISAWVLPLEALRDARVALPGQDPEPLPYLRGASAAATYGLDIALRGAAERHPGLAARPTPRCTGRPPRCWPTSPSTAPACATVTCSAPARSAAPTPRPRGSLLELTWNGQEPLTLADGSTRTFLQDGDTVTITGWAPGPDGTRVGLGEVTGTIVPSRA